MPRGARLDTPGTLHHVIVGGIERRNIVDDDLDRGNFVKRLGQVALDTRTAVYAWALLGNRAHLLLCSGRVGIAACMRRILTGYAVSYNRRHQRHGHLFQNRCKSIICEEDTCFTELVHYIQLNPLRAGLVDSLSMLDRYPWCGHAVVPAKQDFPWQDRDHVLEWFGRTQGAAQRAYREFVQEGIAREESDARILGSSEFVWQVLEEAEQRVRRQLPVADQLETAVRLISDGHTDVPEAPMLGPGQRRFHIERRINENIDGGLGPPERRVFH